MIGGVGTNFEVEAEPAAASSVGGAAGLWLQPDLLRCALALTAGIAIGWHVPHAPPWIMLFAAALLLLLAARPVQRAVAMMARLRSRPAAGGVADPKVECDESDLSRDESVDLRSPSRSRAARSALILLSVVAIGWGWTVVRHAHVPADDLAGMIGDRAVLVRLRGVTSSETIVREGGRGSLAVFSFRPPSSFFRLDVSEVIDRDGRSRSVRGQVLVQCAQTIAPMPRGSVVEVRGFLRRFSQPSNPGEFDRATYARVLGQAGSVHVPHRDLIIVHESSAEGLWSSLGAFRESVRRQATGWLRSNLPEERRPGRDALLAALLLGEREPDLHEVAETFRRVGLAHLLAISGLHLGIFVGLILLLLRLGGGTRSWHAWLLIGCVLLYLFMIDVRLPVLRAGLMTIFGCLGLALGWRVRVAGLVALSAVVLLMWRPQQLFDPGFQLSYGVVLGLMLFTAPLRERWFGFRDQDAPSTSAMMREWFKDLSVGAVVAWLVATPIVLHHFGFLSLWAVPASVLAFPLIAVLLALGYAKIILSAILPSAAIFLSGPLTAVAEVMLAFVEGVDALPLATIHLTPPSTAWAILALIMIVMWMSSDRRLQPRRRSHRLGETAFRAIIIVWLIWPMWLTSGREVLRIDMIAVGDGSCIVVRGGGATVVYDAGSSTDLDAGRRRIIPTIERLGVRTIDAIMLSHADLDHFSAVVELVDRFQVRRVYITPQFIEHAEQDPLGTAAFLHDELIKRVTVIEQITAGAVREFGNMTWTWLHPQPDERYRLRNDSSMVIRVEAEGHRLLLSGDIQREAMASLLGDPESLRADILEMPHHGSWHEIAPEFVEHVQPRIALQSTAWHRLESDPWPARLPPATQRLITARDGAIRVWVDREGNFHVQTFRKRGGSAGDDEEY